MALNFDVARPTFKLKVHGREATEDVRVEDFKALFFVRDFECNPAYNEKKEFASRPTGRKLAVTFKDGEMLVGSSLTYAVERKTFFLFPADPASNNERVLVIMSAVLQVRVVPP